MWGLFQALTFLKKSLNSLAALASSEPGTPVSAMVSWRNLAISRRTLSSFLLFSSYGHGTVSLLPSNLNMDMLIWHLTSWNLSSNVLGSILGNSFNATGSSSSMNGTIKKTANGTRRNKSEVVLRNYSVNRVSIFPPSSKQQTLSPRQKFQMLTCLCSRRVSFPPFNSLWVSFVEIRISRPKSFVPCQ